MTLRRFPVVAACLAAVSIVAPHASGHDTTGPPAADLSQRVATASAAPGVLGLRSPGGFVEEAYTSPAAVRLADGRLPALTAVVVEAQPESGPEDAVLAAEAAMVEAATALEVRAIDTTAEPPAPEAVQPSEVVAPAPVLPSVDAPPQAGAGALRAASAVALTPAQLSGEPEVDWRDRSPGWEQRRGAAALALIRYPWEETGYEIAFLPARRGYRGLTDVVTRRIELYVRPTDSLQQLAFTLAHEIGHAVDVRFSSTMRHRTWLELRGLDPDTPWWPCSRCSDYSSPAGDFAEVFASWLLGPVDYRSALAPPPSDAELELLAPLFVPFTATNGPSTSASISLRR